MGHRTKFIKRAVCLAVVLCAVFMLYNTGLYSTINTMVYIIETLSGYRVSNYMYNPVTQDELKMAFKPLMTDEDADIMKDLLVAWGKITAEANITCFMCCGTLLGSWRHHGKIPWDDDIDLMCDISRQEELGKAIDKMEPNYGKKSLPYNLPIWKFYSSKSHPIKGSNWNYPYLDILFYKLDDEHLRYEVPLLGQYYKYEKSMIFPLIDRPYWNMTLLAPHNTLEFLLSMYDVDMCQSRLYNHEKETLANEKIATVECEKLHSIYPFVHREKDKHGNILETLHYPDEKVKKSSKS